MSQGSSSSKENNTLNGTKADMVMPDKMNIDADVSDEDSLMEEEAVYRPRRGKVRRIEDEDEDEA